MAIEIPQLDSCCCGCTLKTGTKIIGWLELISGILIVISCSLAFVAFTVLEKEMDKPHQTSDGAFPGSKHSMSEQDKEALHFAMLVSKIITVVFIIVGCLNCVLAFILLMGVYQNKAKLVHVWVVVTLIITILSFVTVISQIFAVGVKGAGNIVALLINIYFLLVVHSYYRTIRNLPNNAMA